MGCSVPLMMLMSTSTYKYHSFSIYLFLLSLSPTEHTLSVSAENKAMMITVIQFSMANIFTGTIKQHSKML